MKGSLRSVFAEVRWWAKPQDLGLKERAQRKTCARDGRRLAETAPQAWLTTARSGADGRIKKWYIGTNRMERKMNPEDIPEIPAIGEPEFTEALSALVHSAAAMRKALMLIAGAGADPERVLRDHSAVLTQSEAVIQAWAAPMGIKDE